MTKIIKMLPLVLIPLFLAAEIKFSGDIHIRPRFDQSFKNGEKDKEDFYTMYRARLRAQSD
ncbi:MAG TPA: hypothetical protein ENN84_00070, partial [Candidatus Marinimicrobia bacterium]|nr:hypothetical protein [Candidatus Neomarinimicrobiota bacterium]